MNNSSLRLPIEEFIKKYGELFNLSGQAEISQLHKVVEVDGNTGFEFMPID